MATLARWFLGAWVAAVIVAAFLWLPPAAMFPSPEAARIVAFHLPVAIVSVIAAACAAFYGIRYLMRGRDPLDDARSMTAAALAALFCILTTTTGAVFARVQWGAYWNWDPRQTCIFLLLLIYAAYFVLRAGIDDEEKRASASAVYVVFAFVMTPVLGYIVPKYMMSLHPTNTHFDSQYSTVLLASGAGLIGIFAWMQNIAVRAARVRIFLENGQSAGYEESH